MPRTADSFTIECLKDGRFRFSITSASGLRSGVVREWKRKGFTALPQELAKYRHPKTEYEAKRAVRSLIDWLKDRPGRVGAAEVTAGEWLERFISLDDNPRAARLTGESIPYSPATLSLYRVYFNRYVKDDPFMAVKMRDAEEADALSFQARLGNREKVKAHGGGTIAGTRTYEIALKFVRMAFKEYWLEHPGWDNPFARLKAPKAKKGRERDIIEEHEFRKLLDVIADPLDRAVCAAMYYAGLRRGEIWALKPEDLDWQTPRITIRNAWKKYGMKDRELGDPKWHKVRETPFPRKLQDAIVELWEAQPGLKNKREFVLCRADGTQPGGKYINERLPRWLAAAGIDLKGRHIVPHSARHSLASSLEADNVPIRYIQELLGHSDYTTTRGYLHTVDGAIRSISEKMDKTREAETAEKPENISAFTAG
jgi:integrase/recombinase XerD